MKKILSFIIISFLLIAGQAYATVVKITPEIIDLTTVINTFTVNVEIEDVTALQGFEFEILYDPAVVTANKVVLGNFLTGTFLKLGPTITSGKVAYGAISLSSGSTGGGVLATVTFTKKIASCPNQTIKLNRVDLYDSNVNSLASERRDGYLTIYHIEASAGSNGTISPLGNVPVVCNGNQEFIITPNPGYQIADVKADGSSVGAVSSYTFNNINQNHTIHAEFALKQTCTIEATAGAGGSISPSGTVTVKHGASQTFSITPVLCYRILDVKVDGQSKGAITSYPFDNVTANHTIEAFFEKIKYTISSVADPAETFHRQAMLLLNAEHLKPLISLLLHATVFLM